MLAIQVKRRASQMHTFMEIVKARFGTVTHGIMIVVALMASCIVTAMLLLGGAATIEDLTGVSKIWTAFLTPLLSCWIYTMHSGLKATLQSMGTVMAPQQPRAPTKATFGPNTC